MALNDFRAVFLPYIIRQQDDGRYAVLNREYKPVGFYTREHIEYENYPVLVDLRITPARAAKLSIDGSKDTKSIALYDDATSPVTSRANMKAYLQRLAMLANMRIHKTNEDLMRIRPIRRRSIR